MQETEETPIRSLSQEDSLEEKMAIHSSILAWRNPWIEDPGGLQWEESGVVKSQADRATEHPRECIQCAGYRHV